MACTTILVGKNASYDGSTIVARNEDSSAGQYNEKRFAVMDPKDQVKIYKSVISKVEIELPDNPMAYTYMPEADLSNGVWGCYGVNEKNISMTATETITSNERVLGADPLVEYKKAEDGKEEVKGGVGEEDFVTITLPYINSAREGVIYLGEILKKYGTYEMNGIAFQDENEIWWLETIGGHNWIARKVPDDSYVVMPNQLGIDYFDFEDAYSDKKEFMCSEGLKEMVEKYHLDLRMDPSEDFNPRHAFGSHDDSDHVYNTPRAWTMLKYFNPKKFRQEEISPEDDDLYWALVPEKKITINEVKWVLSNHYQSTEFDPYTRDKSSKNKYRPIGINRTNVLGLVQIRPYVKEEIKALQWMALASNVFNAMIPCYTNITKTPEYLGGSFLKATTDSFYWTNRIIGALADPHYHETSAEIERYQIAVNNKVNEMINKFDQEFEDVEKDKQKEFCEKANQEISDFTQEETQKLLDKVLYIASNQMRNSFSRSDA